MHAVLTVDGETIIAALENGLLAVGSTEVSGRMPQIGGMSLTAEFAAPPGARVRSVLVGGVPIVRSKRYRVVTNVFLANGGDGYKWPGATDVNLSGRGLDTLLGNYLIANNPYTPPAGAPPRITDTS